MVRAIVGSVLVGSLLFLVPAGAFGGDGPAVANEQGNDRPGAAQQDEQAPPGAEQVQDTPAAEKATPLRQEAASNSSGQTDQSLPESVSTTAQAATTADRSPGTTAEAVLDTTPASESGGTGDRGPVELPAALIEPVEPVPLGDVSAAESNPVEVVAQAVPSTSLTTQPARSPSGLALDPLVPASIGLLLLARALRRKPSGDDRTYSL